MDYAKSTIADVPDFPKPGIIFKDITPMLADAKAFDEVIETLATHYRERGVTHFAGIESRGFIFAAPLAKLLNAGLILIRKPGKLPRDTFSQSYELEYGTDTLETAQNNKIQHIIKKLNIKPNQKVLDIGCGWGSLAIDIAKSANCEVTGITLSENQFDYCKKRAKELNLENQLHFKLIDYRELDEKFDRIVSVGMFEHVGRKFYRKFFSQVEKLLKDDGVSLIHTIGSVNPPRDPHPWITKYIFPGGYTPSLSEVSPHIEKSGLIVADIEVLRLHYMHTLRHWKENCLKNKEKIIQMFDERFFRMWEFYLAGCEMAFKWGDQVVYQFQLTKNYSSTPVTRDYIYQ